jgi:hypothetical protein
VSHKAKLNLLVQTADAETAEEAEAEGKIKQAKNHSE